MNSIQTVTLNSALSHNWVGCTVRPPRNQVACTLRAQCPCRGRCCALSKLVARTSCAEPAHVARLACAGRALSAKVVGACRDLLDDQARSRRQSHVATSLLLNQNSPGRDLKNGVATPTSMGQSKPCRDIKSVSRHHSAQSRPRRQN